MTAVWAYPWTLAAEDLGEACETLGESGIEALNVASHYHSVRSLQPRTPNSLFREFPGGCCFSPTEERFDGTPIDPFPIELDGFDDPLETVVETAHDHGLEVNAWTVCLHNSRLGAANPDYRIESAFGDAHDHALCPSHPEVREYFAAVVEAAIARSVDEVHLESIGVPSVFHGHGREFGHDKRQTLTEPVDITLLSQCFCDGCVTAARSHPVDIESARERIRSHLRSSLSNPTASPKPLDELVCDDETIRRLFEFRASVTDQLVERLAGATNGVPMNYYVAESLGGSMSGEEWPAGVRFDRLDTHLDRVTAMCYVSEPAVAIKRVRALVELTECPIDAGVTLDPSVIESEAALNDLVDALSDAIDGRISFYHHGLMTDTQFEWVTSAIDDRKL